MNFFDFNNIESTKLEPIAHGTIAKMFIKIKHGGHDCPEIGIDNPILTKADSDAMYLACEFTITSGNYKGRKIWSNIGVYSTNYNNKWGQMGRCFIRSVIDSIYSLKSDDDSDEAISKRLIHNFSEIEDREFVGRVATEENPEGKKRNVIAAALSASHPDYFHIMGEL